MLNNNPDWDQFLFPYKQAVDELVLKFKSYRKQKLKTGKYSEIEKVTGRVKSVTSILEKANKYGYSIEELEYKLTDIAGIRIICQFEEDINIIVEEIKQRSDIEVIITKNYLEHPKESGYRSIHLIVKYTVITAFGNKSVMCEIQIRTLAMDFWATVEHSLNYKYKGEIPTEIASRLKSTAEHVDYLDREMDEIREEVTEAQQLFRTKSKATTSIIEYISLLNKLGHLQIADKYIKIFTQLSEKDDALQLLLLQKELEEEIKSLVNKNN